MATVNTPFIIPLGEGVPREACLTWGPYDVYKLRSRYTLLLKALDVSVVDVRTLTKIVPPSKDTEGYEQVVFVVESPDKAAFQQILDDTFKSGNECIALASLYHLGYPKWWIDNIAPHLKIKGITIERVGYSGWLALTCLTTITDYIDKTVHLEKILGETLSDLYTRRVFVLPRKKEVALVYPVREEALSGYPHKIISTYDDPLLMKFIIEGVDIVSLSSLIDVSNICDVTIVPHGEGIGAGCSSLPHLVAILKEARKVGCEVTI